MTEPTEEQYAFVADVFSAVIERMIEHSSEISNAYNSQQIMSLRESREGIRRWRKEVVEPSFELLRNQIAELRAEVDKLRAPGRNL